MAQLKLVPAPVPRIPAVPRYAGLVALQDGRTQLVEAPTVSGLYVCARAMGGQLVQIAGGAVGGQAA